MDLKRSEKERLDSDFLGEETLLEILGITKGTLARLIAEKDFPYIRVGIKKIYYEPSIIQWLKDKEVPKVQSFAEK